MWSRRAQEYEAKINSGDLLSITEVVRDLYRSDAQPEQSYSERQLYEAASDRLAREIAAVHRAAHDETLKLMEVLPAEGPAPRAEACGSRGGRGAGRSGLRPVSIETSANTTMKGGRSAAFFFGRLPQAGNIRRDERWKLESASSSLDRA